jgi:hypothetical protein
LSASSESNTAMMGHREKLNGDGFDAFARFWRRNLDWKPGEIAKVKRRYSKRARRDGRMTARTEAQNA